MAKDEKGHGSGKRGFADKASARIELNRSNRMADKHWNKHQAGGVLNASERTALLNALKQKQNAQQYLTSQQPHTLEPAQRKRK